MPWRARASPPAGLSNEAEDGDIDEIVMDGAKAADELRHNQWKQQTTILMQVRQAEKNRMTMLDPRTSRFVHFWDAAMMVALVYTALGTPFEISFVPPSNSALAPLFLLNRLLDCLFLTDLVLQFNLMTFDDESNDWVTSRWQVSNNYLRGWFWLDLGSIAPSSADIISVARGSGDEGGGGSSSSARIFRVIRIVRLLKMLRLLRSSRVVKRLLARFPIPYKAMVMIRLFLLVTLGAHWAACVLSLTTTFSEVGRLDTWLASYGYCWPVHASPLDPNAVYVEDRTDLSWVIDPYAKGSNWGERIAVTAECDDFPIVYLGAFEWGMQLILGVDTEPAPGARPPEFELSGKLRRHEVGVRTAILVCGALIWCYVTAIFVEVMVNTDPNASALRNHVADLNTFIANAHIPREMAQRLREYLYKTRHVLDIRSRKQVLDNLSVELQGEVAMLTCKRWLHDLPIFRPRSIGEANDPRRRLLLSAVALALEGAVFAPAECLPGNQLWILQRGLVAFCGQVLGKDRVWGYRAMTYSEWLPHRMARALSYCELLHISCAKVRALAHEYDPTTDVRIRWMRTMEALRAYLLAAHRKRVAAARAAQQQDKAAEFAPASPGTAGALAEEAHVHLERQHSVMHRLSTDLGGAAEACQQPPAAAEGGLESLRKEVRGIESTMATMQAEMQAAMLDMQQQIKRTADGVTQLLGRANDVAPTVAVPTATLTVHQVEEKGNFSEGHRMRTDVSQREHRRGRGGHPRPAGAAPGVASTTRCHASPSRTASWHV